MSQHVALPDGYPSLYISPSDAPGADMITYELAGPRISGAVTINTGPLIHPSRMEISSGRYLDYTPTSLAPFDLLQLDGFHILTAHETDRHDPYWGMNMPLVGLDETFRPVALPPDVQRHANAVFDTVTGLWLDNHRAHQSIQPGHGKKHRLTLPPRDPRRPAGFRNHKPGRHHP